MLPWARLSQERRDLCLRTLPCDPGGVLDLDAAASVIGPRTAVVAVGLMTHLDGVVQPIGELARLVRERSRALLVVDAAQALGRIPVDAAGLGADVLLGTGRKALLGPLGAGFMLLRPGLADRLRPADLKDACRASGQKLNYRERPGYDHGYYFVSTFIGEHLKFHAAALS